MEVVKLQEKDLITELILMLKNVKLCNSLKETYVLKTLSLLLVLKSLWVQCLKFIGRFILMLHIHEMLQYRE